MPIEGLPVATPAAPAAATPDAAVNNTAGVADAGAETQAANQAEAQKEKTFTQADVDRIIANRVKSGIKAELKKLGGEGEGAVTLEDLQQQLNDERTARQALEARQSVREYITDAQNQLNVRPENVAAIEELVNGRLQFEKGKPTNLKEAINAVKSLAPALFTNQPSSINAAEGRKSTADVTNMDSWIRTGFARKG